MPTWLMAPPIWRAPPPFFLTLFLSPFLFQNLGLFRAYALRDYSDGEMAFQTALPASLEGKVPPKEYEDSIKGINKYVARKLFLTRVGAGGVLRLAPSKCPPFARTLPAPFIGVGVCTFPACLSFFFREKKQSGGVLGELGARVRTVCDCRRAAYRLCRS